MKIAAWIVLLLGASLACSGAGGEREREPPSPAGSLAVVGGKVDDAGRVLLVFEEQPVGETRELALILRNEGSEEVALTLAPPSAPFLLAKAPATIGGGEQAELLFRFAPKEVGSFEGEAEVRYEGGSIVIRLGGAAGKEAACELSASRSSLRFTAEEGEPLLTRLGRLRLTNEGGRSCQIRSLRIEGSTKFSLVSSLGFELMPGASRDVVVHFLPGVGAEAVLVVAADDAELRIELGTKTANDCLRAGDEGETLRVVGGGCAPSEVEVENACDENLSIDLASTPGFRLGGERKPTSLMSKDTADLHFEFVPTTAPWERAGDFILHAENGDRIRWRLSGELEWREESFEAEPLESQDLLVVLDVAESLAAYDSDLQTIASDLALQMKYAWDTDLRVHVTTTSMEAEGDCGGEVGRLVPLDGSRPATVTWETPDREEVLLANLRPPACQTGGGQGLAAIEAALGEDGWPEWRRGRLRVVIVSVEDDASPGDVAHYLSRFEREVEGGHRYVDELHLLVPTDSCPNHLPAARYLSLEPPATSRPICFSFHGAPGSSPFVAELADTPADLDGNGVVDLRDGAEVFLDGVPYTDLWIIDEGWLRLGLWPGKQPVLRGSRIEVRYPRACE